MGYKKEIRDASKGVRYDVVPFKKPKEIERIKQYLIGKPNKRDYLLFVLGINIGLRCGDLVSLKLGDVSTSKTIIKDKVQIIEGKTDKLREFELNTSAKKAIKLYLSSIDDYSSDLWLFPSRKGDNHISVDSIRKIIKTFCNELNIRGNFGSHSLRKTFGYHCYINNIQTNPLVLPTLQKLFNHSNSLITQRYIGITSDEISNLYLNLNL